jgi:predicted nucleic acid-binding protein
VARRLIPDSGVLIVAERSALDLGSVIGDDDDVVIAAISVTELCAGIELADEGNRARRSEFIAHLLELIPVELYDLSIAEALGWLMADFSPHRHPPRCSRLEHRRDCCRDAKDDRDKGSFREIRRASGGGMRCAAVTPAVSLR